jgi:cold shock CspA family protein
MPIRVYDLSKKLGIESNVVLARAKEMGIAQAKVPSSALDRITAAYLEEALVKIYPPPAPPVFLAPAAPPEPFVAPPPVVAIVTEPPPVEVQPVTPAMPETLPFPEPAPVMPVAPIKIPKPLWPSPRPSTDRDHFRSLNLPGITIRTMSPEIHGLVKRILAGEIPVVIEVSCDDGCPPIRAKLVPELSSITVPQKPKVEPPPRAELDEHTRRIFRGALLASCTSKDGWVNLAEYGTTLKKLDPTFQPQDFGEKSLGGLIRRIGIFEIKTDGNTPPVYFIREKSQAPTIQMQVLTSPPQESTPARRRATGKVHNLKLGFGFIAPDDGSENAFFHATEVIGCTVFDLRPGDPVEYEAGQNERGACAWKVKRLSGTS